VCLRIENVLDGDLDFLKARAKNARRDNPDDTREAIGANPRTPMSQQFRDDGLIVDKDVAPDDGTTAVVRGIYLPALEIEFLRWRAERGMKLKHLPAAFLHRHSS
jgi:hypothetical protein